MGYHERGTGQKHEKLSAKNSRKWLPKRKGTRHIQEQRHRTWTPRGKIGFNGGESEYLEACLKSKHRQDDANQYIWNVADQLQPPEIVLPSQYLQDNGKDSQLHRGQQNQITPVRKKRWVDVEDVIARNKKYAVAQIQDVLEKITKIHQTDSKYFYDKNNERFHFGKALFSFLTYTLL